MREQSLPVSFGVGSFAGFLAAVITSPLDVVKTRIQCQTPTSITQYTGVIDGLSQILESEGPKALFRGTVARATNAGLSFGIMLGSYGWLRAQLVLQSGKQDQPLRVDYAAERPLPPAAEQLQSWHTRGLTEYGYAEGLWPSSTPPTVAKQDFGFIRPLKLLSRTSEQMGGKTAAPVAAPEAATFAQKGSALPLQRDDGFIPPLPNPLGVFQPPKFK
jgi:hypothetical protein